MNEDIVATTVSSPERTKEIIISYVLLSVLSLASRLIVVIWIGVVIFLLTFPSIWSRFSRLKTPAQPEKSSRVKALGIGGLLGAMFFIYCIIQPDAWDQFPPPFYEIQLLLGFVINALVLAPMQEIYFRNWLQPRLEELLGSVKALVLTSFLFMLWHLMPPFQSGPMTQISIDVQSLLGMLATFILGLMCGIAYIKSRRLLAPWLAHTIAGTTLVILGKVVLFTYIE